MLNNKGQSLILFVLILPVLVLALILVIDIGKVISLKQELNSINEIVLDYGLDNIDNENLENDMKALINLNKDDISSINIDLDDEKIYLEMSCGYQGILTGFINIDLFKIKTSYVGYILEGQKRIERVGD